MSEPAIAVHQLDKVFPLPFKRTAVVALQNLSFSVAQGEIYGLLGPNGSGKSTTLKILLGLVSPTRGRTSILGVDSREVRSRRSVGFLPENPYFYKFLTGAETLRFFGKLASLSGNELTARIEETLAIVSLDYARDRRLATYSKGMLQRIGLAQALINQPRVVVLDEPTAGVDPAGSRDIANLILRLKQQGTTVLLSSHLLAQVQEICDRVGILSQGILVREGSLNELVASRDRTELVLEGATPETIRDVRDAIARTSARVVEQRAGSRTLEEVFLEATGENKPPESKGP